MVLLLAGISVARPAAAQKAGVVVVGQGVDVKNLDPARAAGVPGATVIWHIFDPLVTRTADMKPAPALATSWKRVDRLTWQFALRKNVVFHNGKPFTARAVKYSLERLYDPATKSTSPVPKNVPLDRIDVVDDYTINIVTKTPVPVLPELLIEYAWIVEPDYYAASSLDHLAANPVGTGSYRFVEWVKDDHTTVEAFPRHWRGKPANDRIVWRVIPEDATRVAELRAGSTDVITNLPPDLSKEVSGSDSLAVEGVQGGRRIYIGMVNDMKPFDDVRVRRALNLGVDVQTIIDTLLVKGGKRMAGFANTPHENPRLTPYPYDPAKAKQLLAEAGFPTGFSTVLEHPVGRYLKDAEVAQAVAADLGKIGVKVRLQPMEFSVWIDTILKRGFKGLYMLGESGYFECQQDMYDLHKDYAYNASKWRNADFERTFDQIAQEGEPRARRDLCNRLQQIAYDDAPLIFLYKQYDLYGVNRRLPWKPRADERIILYETSAAK